MIFPARLAAVIEEASTRIISGAPAAISDPSKPPGDAGEALQAEHQL